MIIGVDAMMIMLTTKILILKSGYTLVVIITVGGEASKEPYFRSRPALGLFVIYVYMYIFVYSSCKNKQGIPTIA